MGAGITIYAPAIVLSTVFGWSLSITIIASGLVVIAYTVAGGSDAVTHTQKYQIGVIFAGMIAAFIILVHKIPCSFTDALTLAGHFGKTQAVSFSTSPKERYTFWSGMLGGLFLLLSYFGTDQSQVQRYISGDDLRESRLGLMFNALFKIPMQFGILLLGVMLFVFYQFHPAPILFNKSVWASQIEPEIRHIERLSGSGFWNYRSKGNPGPGAMYLDTEFTRIEKQQHEALQQWQDARSAGDPASAADALQRAEHARDQRDEISAWALNFAKNRDPSVNTNGADYVFIDFILDNLPHGLIGLLVAAFFAAALSSKAAELNALASTTTIDFYRPFIRKTKIAQSPPATEDSELRTQNSELPSDDRHYVLASKAFTAFWGLVAIAFALFAHLAENLIQASNIVGSVFSGVVLGLFLIAFFLKHIGGTAAFAAALIAQTLVLVIWALTFFNVIDLAYLWFNAIGSLACIALALIIQQLLLGPPDAPGFPIETRAKSA